MDGDGATTAFIKDCCASVYGSELVQLLLGGRLHPGGDELTRRLADLTGIGPGDRVLDVASGLGTTARLLSAERDTAVAGLGHLSSFEVGDAERLPVREASFDVVLCECALCTFPDQVAAVAGFRRALGPGGRVGIADVTVDRDRLPAELDTPIGRVACVAGALPASGYERLLRESGFTEVKVEPHREAAVAAVDSIRGGLAAVHGALAGLFDAEEAMRLVDLASDAVRDGVIGYALVTATLGDAEFHVSEAMGGRRADGSLH